MTASMSSRVSWKVPRGGQRQRVDLRRDHERAGRAERPADLYQAERVRGPDPERADGELAPGVRTDLVAELPVAAGLDLVEHEPRPAAQRVRGDVLGQQHAGTQPRHV